MLKTHVGLFFRTICLHIGGSIELFGIRNMRGFRRGWGWGQGVRIPLNNYKAKGFPSNTANGGPVSARQRNAIDGLLIVVFGPSLSPHQLITLHDLGQKF